MEPSVLEGDVVFASSLFRPGPHNIAIIRDPEDAERLLIKRILRAGEQGYWVEGDYKERSRDSRSFGWVPQKLLLGRVWKIFPGRGSLTAKFVV